MRHCIACGKELPEKPLFVLEHAPASAQDIPDEQEVKTDEGVTLELCRCGHCGLVQFDCEPVGYYRDVIRAGGFSTTMTELRRRQYRHLIETYHLEGKKFLEVGCGRGEFLQVLREFPVKVYGIEHRDALVQIARESGLAVWKEFPESETQKFGASQECLWDEEPFDVFLSFNFLEHQPHPDVMLKAIWHNLSENGMGLVTVPSLEYILEQGSYYELIRDHIAYYSFGTLRTLLESCGFAVLEEEMVNRDTIAMIVRKKPEGWTEEAENAGILDGREIVLSEVEKAGVSDGQEDVLSGTESDRGEQDARSAAVRALIDGYETVNADITKLIETLTADHKRLAIWGASHQGFTLAATTALGDFAEYIIDSAPFKQGRFAPSSHLPIVAPDAYFDDPVDAVLIVAPGYTDEIAGIIRARFGSEVQVMTLRTNRIERL